MYKKIFCVVIVVVIVFVFVFGIVYVVLFDDMLLLGGFGMYWMYGGYEGGLFGVIMKLYDQLKFNVLQEQQWQVVVNMMKQNCDVMCKSYEQMCEQFKVQQNQLIFDLSVMYLVCQQVEVQNV